MSEPVKNYRNYKQGSVSADPVPDYDYLYGTNQRISLVQSIDISNKL